MAFCVSRMRESVKYTQYILIYVCVLIQFSTFCKYASMSRIFEAKPGSLKLGDVKNIEFKHGKLALNQTLTLKHFALFQQLNFWKEHHHHHGLLSTLPP